MTFFPFSLSYLIMTPGRVRLPGEPGKRSTPPASPSSQRSHRWSTEFSTKARARAVSFNRRLSSGPSKVSRAPSEFDCLIDEDPEFDLVPTRA
ncbi:hypothetical protein D9611_012497 [Ephemerocybe angulata]|uniref:Uncharacterized protein n=2 Tax=Ephemerocybe angulata TaxID=980116 RepID=A0A8H5CAT3_9AGAR|nr:hypothetical protein D9611_012497 [Tulosesus angulatus]KAF6761670.1 hypothetical protein DFP72DRAFT_879303 [Tulosesus angulatus]